MGSNFSASKIDHFWFGVNMSKRSICFADARSKATDATHSIKATKTNRQRQSPARAGRRGSSSNCIFNVLSTTQGHLRPKAGCRKLQGETVSPVRPSDKTQLARHSYREVDVSNAEISQLFERGQRGSLSKYASGIDWSCHQANKPKETDVRQHWVYFPKGSTINAPSTSLTLN